LEPTQFRRLSSTKTGITFTNQLENAPELNILNYLYFYNGAGVIAADFNNDNLVDLYLSGNQIPGALFINKGGLRFQRIETAMASSKNGNWTTGVTQVDINHDGLLDIYICRASGYRNLLGRNELYVNMGLDANGYPSFEEKAKEYGLDFMGLSTKAAFFDYDLDGDLDMYLLNHSVHPNINYGNGNQRKVPDSLSGDRLYKNDNGYYKDISVSSGIFQGKSGYGLGLSIGDLNNDGYPDIYVGNDFFENDYLYLNQQNGTFKEVISENDLVMGHTTHFSMGNALSDINNDGFVDLISVDMLPEHLITYKTSGLEYAYPIYSQYLKNGYAPQYMQNTLHLNNSGNSFSEIANVSGIDATEWSWGPLAADFDNDGFKDLFVTNGIMGATNDMDYMNFIANADIQKRIDAGMKDSDMPLINEIPEKKVANYFFRNNGDLTFSNTTAEWIGNEPTYSNGSAYADLDNDGDLDLIVNNINQEVFILENTLEKKSFLKIKLFGAPKNKFGIGTKLIAYSKSGTQMLEQYPGNSYLSSNSNQLIFGLGTDSIVDSLKLIWPNGYQKKVLNIKVNQEISIAYDEDATLGTLRPIAPKTASIPNQPLVDFVHNEKPTLDFNKEPLIPFASSNEGPTITVADINNDGLDDFFIGGPKMQASRLFVQDSLGKFRDYQKELFEEDAINEDVASAFLDANGDGLLDLLVASGGNEFLRGNPLKPRLYINTNGKLKKDPIAFQNIELNASAITVNDFDADGDIDVVLTADQVPTNYGQTPEQYFFINDGSGNFTNAINRIAPALKYIGSVKDMTWTDVNGDSIDDLVVVGHWMPISIFINNGVTLELQNNNELVKTNGWWNSILALDIDNDGDQDLVAGNWGNNTKFEASVKYPITLYNYDFDGNGKTDPVITFYHQKTETPFASKDELVKQLPFLNKKYLSYSDFASASITDLFGSTSLRKSNKKKVYELQSSIFINDGSGNFSKFPLPTIAQISAIHDIISEDFDSDGFNDLLIVGNNFEISTQLGRLDALHGLILYNSGNSDMPFQNKYDMLEIQGASRGVHNINIQNQKYFIVGRNNNSPFFYRYND
jgi:hypothetical protein